MFGLKRKKPPQLTETQAENSSNKDVQDENPKNRDGPEPPASPILPREDLQVNLVHAKKNVETRQESNQEQPAVEFSGDFKGDIPQIHASLVPPEISAKFQSDPDMYINIEDSDGEIDLHEKLLSADTDDFHLKFEEMTRENSICSKRTERPVKNEVIFVE
jgi:hypothetical protein